MASIVEETKFEPLLSGEQAHPEKLDALAHRITEYVARQSKPEEETVPYTKILLTYADNADKALMALGYLIAILAGLGLLSFVYFFGDVVDSFGQDFDIVN